jgi:hypothetical protein
VPSRAKLASGVAVAFVLLVGAAVALANREQPVALPSPTPTATLTPETPSPTPSIASPSPTPTPTPTAVATRSSTPRPRPTTNAAGQQLMTYYFQARAVFPIFPPTPQIDFDEPAGSDGDAWYRGLNLAGQPIFAVRTDYTMTPSTAFHELGHAYQDLVQRKTPTGDVMDKYWTFRGFPGTWQDAYDDANLQPVGMAQWIQLPGESWAEAFSVAMVGGGREKTLDYGRTINPFATKQFFVSLLPAAP